MLLAITAAVCVHWHALVTEIGAKRTCRWGLSPVHWEQWWWQQALWYARCNATGHYLLGRLSSVCWEECMLSWSLLLLVSTLMADVNRSCMVFHGGSGKRLQPLLFIFHSVTCIHCVFIFFCFISCKWMLREILYTSPDYLSLIYKKWTTL